MMAAAGSPSPTRRPMPRPSRSADTMTTRFLACTLAAFGGLLTFTAAPEAGAGAGQATAVAAAQPSAEIVARAKAIHATNPVIDGHNDYPWALRETDPGRDFAKADITGPVPAL